METMEDQVVSLKSHKKTGSGVSVSSKDGSYKTSDIRMSLTKISGVEEDLSKDDLLRKVDMKEEFRLNLDRKLSANPSTSERFSVGDMLEKSPTNTLTTVKRSQTLRTVPSLNSLKSNLSFASIDELDSAYTAYKKEEENRLPSHQEIKQGLKKNPEMNSKCQLFLIFFPIID